MDIREFTFRKEQEPKKSKHIIILVCDSCGDMECRPRCVQLTGHVHDQTCTYICKVCRGPMREPRV